MAVWQVLATLHALHWLCVSLRVLRPRLHVDGGGLASATSIILLNSMNLAVACR